MVLCIHRAKYNIIYNNASRNTIGEAGSQLVTLGSVSLAVIETE